MRRGELTVEKWRGIAHRLSRCFHLRKPLRISRMQTFEKPVLVNAPVFGNEGSSRVVDDLSVATPARPRSTRETNSLLGRLRRSLTTLYGTPLGDVGYLVAAARGCAPRSTVSLSTMVLAYAVRGEPPDQKRHTMPHGLRICGSCSL